MGFVNGHPGLELVEAIDCDGGDLLWDDGGDGFDGEEEGWFEDLLFDLRVEHVHGDGGGGVGNWTA